MLFIQQSIFVKREKMKPMRRHFVVLFIILKSDETLMADNSRINYVSIKGCIITATVSARTKTIIS